MNLKISNGSKEFKGEPLFKNVEFEIRNHEKVAIIGRNGCGKTTLLRCITGEYELDEGTLSIAPNISIGYLSQKAFENEELTVQQAFDLQFQHVLKLKDKMDRLAIKMAEDYSDEVFKEYSDVQTEYEALNGYNYNQEQLTLFTKFGFSTDDLNRPISTFSGGQKTRIAFVQLLMKKPDILLLDEPTNHLDMQTIEWLEGYLSHYPKAIILVSHDRMFLDHIVSEVYEFEFGRLTHYMGNYSQYVELKKIAMAQQATAYKNQQEEIKRLEEQIEKFRYKKNKAAFAQSKIKYLDRLERVEAPREDKKQMHLHFEKNIKGGNNVLMVEKLVIGYDHPLAEISLQIRSTNRLAVIGPNGLGKSTFVKTLMGQVQALSGSYLFGHQIEVAYFDQQLAQVDSNKTVLEELWDLYPQYDHTAIRKILGSFLFSAEDVFKSCSVLSGGEKVRLTLCKMMLSKANLLILDEPTNHLDIASKEALEEALLNYDGTIIFVSHDRYFINKLATSVLYIGGEKTQYYALNYQEYLDKINGIERKEQQQKQAEEVPTVSQQTRANGKKAAMLEKQIARAEKELEDLRALRFDEEYYHDYQKMQQLDETIDDKHNEIEHLMKEWEQYAG